MSRDARRPPSTSSTSATTQTRLAGTTAHRGRSCPTRWSRTRGRSTSRRTSRSPAGSSTRSCRLRRRSYAEAVRAKVLIRPKQGILDPQGKAVERALPALGFEGIHDVRVGRLVELEVDDPAKLDSLSEKLLANPLIEDYEIVVNGDGE